MAARAEGRTAWLEPLRRVARRVLRRDVAAQVWFQPQDIDRLRDLFYGTLSGQGEAWTPYRDAHLVLPDWFEPGLDPWGDAYREQQLRLWQLLAGVDRAYDPVVDEIEAPWGDGDVVRSPGYYMRRDPGALVHASDHWLGTGMLLKHAGVKPGERALEYGAGFGQTALAMARLGVRVDTVDISTTFCAAIQKQAEFYGVPLQPHQGRFGFHPPHGEPYQLIWFYESFHHCLDFQDLVPQLRRMLAPGGSIVLAGEPILQSQYAAIPYPWGLRLHSETVAVVRQTHWMELGFTEAFIMELFRRNGFAGRRIDCEPSVFGKLFVFELERRPV